MEEPSGQPPQVPEPRRLDGEAGAPCVDVVSRCLGAISILLGFLALFIGAIGISLQILGYVGLPAETCHRYAVAVIAVAIYVLFWLWFYTQLNKVIKEGCSKGGP